MQKPGAIQLSLQRQLKLARKAESAFKSTPPARERERDYVHLIIISQCNLATFDPETFTKLSPGVGGAEPRWQHFHHQVQPHQRIDPGKERLSYRWMEELGTQFRLDYPKASEKNHFG